MLSYLIASFFFPGTMWNWLLETPGFVRVVARWAVLVKHG